MTHDLYNQSRSKSSVSSSSERESSGGIAARLKELIDSYIQTERQAARAYRTGVSDLDEDQRRTYLAYAEARDRRVREWSELYARLDFDLFHRDVLGLGVIPHQGETRETEQEKER